MSFAVRRSFYSCLVVRVQLTVRYLELRPIEILAHDTQPAPTKPRLSLNGFRVAHSVAFTVIVFGSSLAGAIGFYTVKYRMVVVTLGNLITPGKDLGSAAFNNVQNFRYVLRGCLWLLRRRGYGFI